MFQDKVQDLLLSEISDEDKQDFLREAFEDVYVCYKFPDSIGWRAVKLVYESGE